MHFDFSVNLGNLLTIISFLGGGLAFAVSIKDRVQAQSDRIRSMESKMDNLVDIMISQGRQDEKIASQDGKIMAIGSRQDDLDRKLERLFTPRTQL